jgi:DNA-binding transcriptional ArsR family regulator
MKSRQTHKDASRLFQAIGEKSRLKIIKLCIDHECSVDELLDKTGLEKTLLSKHLKVLRDADILQSRRNGRQASYKVNRKIRSTKALHTINLHCCEIKLK